MQLLISQFRGVLHKPRIGIIPDPFPPGESGLATLDYIDRMVCICSQFVHPIVPIYPRTYCNNCMHMIKAVYGVKMLPCFPKVLFKFK